MRWALRWALRPLRRIQAQLNELDNGVRVELDSVQPVELKPLVTSLNHYVVHQEALRTSHRQALDDLAHSLKTPLSVLSVGVKEPQPDLTLLQEQVVRMRGIVDHQLSRVARVTQTDGAATQRWVSIGQVISQLVRALSVAYRNHRFDVVEADEWALRIHEDDLLDMLGNVLENACKYGAGQVRITTTAAGADSRHLRIDIEDDGPGIAADFVADVVNRGTRLDSQTPGQGIGLSLVSELLAIYGGRLEITSGELGGAKVGLVFFQGRRLKASVSSNAE
jgi:two-component system sensor histidine kinase PhoQ